MYGVIVGDYIGSYYKTHKYKNKIVLFHATNYFSKTTYITMAILEAYNKGYIQNKNYSEISNLIKEYKKKNNQFDLANNDTEIINYVSVLPWFTNNEEELLEYINTILQCFDYNKEDYKIICLAALCIYYALIGKSKDYINQYIKKTYPSYNRLNNIVNNNSSVTTLLNSLICFFNTNGLINCLYKAIANDCNITYCCAIAEAYYGFIPIQILKTVLNKLDNQEVINTFKGKFYQDNYGSYYINKEDEINKIEAKVVLFRNDYFRKEIDDRYFINTILGVKNQSYFDLLINMVINDSKIKGLYYDQKRDHVIQTKTNTFVIHFNAESPSDFYYSLSNLLILKRCKELNNFEGIGIAILDDLNKYECSLLIKDVSSTFNIDFSTVVTLKNKLKEIESRETPNYLEKMDILEKIENIYCYLTRSSRYLCDLIYGFISKNYFYSDVFSTFFTIDCIEDFNSLSFIKEHFSNTWYSYISSLEELKKIYS